jgi:hypothetical protein
VRNSLDRWEPRIEPTDVVGTLRGTDNPRNLVFPFPFYVIPSHDAPPAGPRDRAAPSIQESAR